MTLWRPILLLTLVAAACLAAKAQSPMSNLRIKKVAVLRDSMVLDTLSIIPKSFSIAEADTSSYHLDFVKSVLHWKQHPPVDSVTLIYRVFPFQLNSTIQRFSYDSVVNNFYAVPFEFNRNSEDAKRLLDFGNIQYNGSFGRALSFGNNQSAVVNSNFQLQLNGMLKDSIEIAAALSDNNIPIQPDGTTQQLNEFDQVFLQFKKKNWQLNLGDIDIRQNTLYFLKFYKRLQGISFQTTNYISPSVQSTTLISGSIAKGKFTRNVFQGLEGNQGPYRLQGANNEFFFIVLANTEKVYLDGELLQRGEDQDYIINYNTAEVTFMPRRMITKDSRIQVEFEYADRNYLNSNLYAYQELAINKRLKIKVGAFDNTDAKNSQINQTLDNKQKQFLYDIGDSANKAFYPAIALDTFSTSKILYQKLYDSSGQTIDSFYRYSVDPAVAKYNLSFTDLGQGNGNYVPELNGANGKVYKYVSPLNGIRQGRFEPVVVLVAPKKQQLITLGADYQIDANNSLKTEFAISNYDVNRFSAKDKADNTGIAAKVQFENSFAINQLRLTSNLDYEHVQQSFKPIERLRYVEFTREWGLPLIMSSATENILRFSSQLKNKANEGLTYQFMTYQRSDNYTGYQNILQHTFKLMGWAFNNQFAITNFHNQNQNGSYIRPVIDISKQLRQLSSIQVGFRYALERNAVKSMGDSLSSSSFYFDTYSAYLKTDESKKNKYGLTFFTRADKYPFTNKLNKGDRSYNVNLQAELLKSTKHQLLFNTTYRLLEVYNPVLSPQKKDRTLLGRAEYLVNEWKGLLTGNMLYELGTGQEQKRDYAYLEVPAGQGEYTWIDYNGDNIQQVNEFEVALYKDQAKYIRIYTPTNQFVKANYTTFNYSLNINPKALAGQHQEGFGKLISLLNFQSSLQKTKKSIAKGDFEFNPFNYSIQDTALLTNNTSFLNTLSFNRFSSTWGIDFSNLRNSGKSLLTYGYESRLVNDWNGKLRWNFSLPVSLEMNARHGMNGLYSPKFDNRNYELQINSVEPKITYVRGTLFRLQGSYKLENKTNKEQYGGEKSLSNSLSVESKYNVLQNSSINARFTFSSIDFTRPGASVINPTVEYIILDALRPGSNYLWSLDFTKKLMNNVEMNFQYEGRKPGETRTIHTGRASIRALF